MTVPPCPDRAQPCPGHARSDRAPVPPPTRGARHGARSDGHTPDEGHAAARGTLPLTAAVTDLPADALARHRWRAADGRTAVPATLAADHPDATIEQLLAFAQQPGGRPDPSRCPECGPRALGVRHVCIGAAP